MRHLVLFSGSFIQPTFNSQESMADSKNTWKLVTIVVSLTATGRSVRRQFEVADLSYVTAFVFSSNSSFRNSKCCCLDESTHRRAQLVLLDFGRQLVYICKICLFQLSCHRARSFAKAVRTDFRYFLRHCPTLQFSVSSPGIAEKSFECTNFYQLSVEIILWLAEYSSTICSHSSTGILIFAYQVDLYWSLLQGLRLRLLLRSQSLSNSFWSIRW